MSIQSVITRRTLHDEIITLLRTMIFEGDLRPGSRISEQRLCARFGVSRTPLREALKVLSAEGLVRLLPNKGASVTRVTKEEVEEIIPVLGTLEAFAGELACARIDDAGLARIRALHREIVEHYQCGDERSYREVNRTFHETIFAIAGSKILNETYDMLQIRLKSLMFVTTKAPPRWAEAVDDHERMMEALEAQDDRAFALVARQHISHKADLMRMALDVLDGRPGRGAELTRGKVNPGSPAGHALLVGFNDGPRRISRS
jgi:DNA-binding GntR family transcriptional regulator